MSIKMPTYRVQNLYNICLNSIVCNVNFWLKLKKDHDKNGKKYSPFSVLPASLEQELLDTYVRIHSLPDRYNFWLEHQEKWRLFITEHISRLAITDYTEKASLLHIAATCRNLKYLDIKNVYEALPCLKTIAPCLKTVVSLNFVTMAHINSTTLKYIRSHCPNLRFLGLRSCVLNDKALGHLKHINTLTELDIRDTEVTASGICLVLKHNPQLRSLHHPEVVRGLYKMHSSRTWLVRVESSLLSSTMMSYQLRDIEFEISKKDHPGMLAVVVSSCPAIERVRVEVDASAPADSLAPLAKLQYLTELDVQCCGDSTHKGWDDPASAAINLFACSIVPILEARGRNLYAFTLEGIVSVDMQLIEHLCPNLVSLGLYYNSYLEESFIIPEDLTLSKPFPGLRRLLFGSNSGDSDFPSEYLEWLLSNQDLEELSLSGSPLFNIELFNNAFANSSAYPNLRRLELDYCNVTADVIIEFLYHCGRKSLRELSICGPFVREQAAPSLCYILCEKLDVQLEAYFYSFVKLKKRLVRYKQDLTCISSELDMISLHNNFDHCRLIEFIDPN
ncbi:uncharacterized protein LOC126187629 isoform X1 [Schistocerca cancellata]|uniref:uncharacterized protein LOC126187629 isoform X1 n=1 Tax=Schistocerca cancellata TaxID=274614 RepID=UPI002118B191|nr:uncharacterized protein LOC126187629 isoform X1 [Schistocerca cancellata]